MVQANKQATIRLKMDYVTGVIVMFEWDFRSFSGLRHVVKHGLDSLVKHGLDSLVKHGLY